MDRKEIWGKWLLAGSTIVIILANLAALFVFFSLKGVMPVLLAALILINMLLLWLMNEGYEGARFGTIVYTLIVFSIGFFSESEDVLSIGNYSIHGYVGTAVLKKEIFNYAYVAVLVVSAVLMKSKTIPEYMYGRMINREIQGSQEEEVRETD